MNYDETNWRRIAEYLNNGDHKKIPVGNRIQLLDTAFKLLQSRQISPDIFLKLSNYLCQETDGVVWNYVISILKKLEKYTRSPTGGEALKVRVDINALTCALYLHTQFCLKHANGIINLLRMINVVILLRLL